MNQPSSSVSTGFQVGLKGQRTVAKGKIRGINSSIGLRFCPQALKIKAFPFCPEGKVPQRFVSAPEGQRAVATGKTRGNRLPDGPAPEGQRNSNFSHLSRIHTSHQTQHHEQSEDGATRI
jgi:hypothetical protein